MEIENDEVEILLEKENFEIVRNEVALTLDNDSVIVLMTTDPGEGYNLPANYYIAVFDE